MNAIHFSQKIADETIRAILDGRKTTMPQPVKFLPGFNPQWTGYVPDGAVLYGSNNIPAAKTRYRPGDILYVQETFFKYAGEYVYRASTAQPELWNGMW